MENAQMDKSLKEMKRMVIIVAVVLLVIILGFIFQVTRGIIGPLKEAVHVANCMADNDLTVTSTSKSKDEAGQLLKSMGKMVSNLSQTISANIEASGLLADGASNQAASLEETSSSLILQVQKQHYRC